MIRSLKAALVIWGVAGILIGLVAIFMPEKIEAIWSFEKGPPYVGYLHATIGATIAVMSAFVIIASRNPIRHILWVRLVTVLNPLGLAVVAYSLIRGDITMRQATIDLVAYSVFTLVFLILYPYRASKAAES